MGCVQNRDVRGIHDDGIRDGTHDWVHDETHGVRDVHDDLVRDVWDRDGSRVVHAHAFRVQDYGPYVRRILLYDVHASGARDAHDAHGDHSDDVRDDLHCDRNDLA